MRLGRIADQIASRPVSGSRIAQQIRITFRLPALRMQLPRLPVGSNLLSALRVDRPVGNNLWRAGAGIESNL